MPEGPEVRTIADELRFLIGYEIIDCKIFRPYKGKYNLSTIVGKYITNILCFGKKIAFQLNEGYILTSLIMTGKWLFSNVKDKAILSIHFVVGTYDHVSYGRKENVELFFHDDRRLGDVSYYNDEDFMNIYQSIGLDFLNDQVSFEHFLEIARESNRTMVCNFLLDQSKISGIGNYLRCDILYDAQIDPFLQMKNLSDDDIRRLYFSCQYIIQKSYESGGHSISDGSGNYMLPSGKRGQYKPLIYGKKYDSEGRKVERHKNKGGQTLYYVEFTMPI